MWGGVIVIIVGIMVVVGDILLIDSTAVVVVGDTIILLVNSTAVADAMILLVDSTVLPVARAIIGLDANLGHQFTADPRHAVPIRRLSIECPDDPQALALGCGEGLLEGTRQQLLRRRGRDKRRVRRGRCSWPP